VAGSVTMVGRRGSVSDQSEALQISISQSEGFIQEPDGGRICDHGWQQGSHRPDNSLNLKHLL
jgi:hypothetical protein